MVDRGESGARHHAEAVRRRLADSGLSRPGPSSVSWKVNRETFAVAGWGRAVLLQFAHPLIAEGIGDHSSFDRGLFSGFERLFSTIRAMQSLTFGDTDEVVAAAASVNLIHDRVFGRLSAAAGPFAKGTRYSAHLPHLLAWVHATLLDSIPQTYERLVGPLTPAERDRYCDEAAIMEPLFGIPPGTLPRSAAALTRYVDGMFAGGEIVVTDKSRALARAVLSPPVSRMMWPVFRPVRLLTIGTLPAPVREAYGYSWTPRDERALDRWCRAIKGGRRILPATAREWHAARRAERRAPTPEGRLAPAVTQRPQ